MGSRFVLSYPIPISNPAPRRPTAFWAVSAGGEDGKCADLVCRCERNARKRKAVRHRNFLLREGVPCVCGERRSVCPSVLRGGRPGTNPGHRNSRNGTSGWACGFQAALLVGCGRNEWESRFHPAGTTRRPAASDARQSTFPLPWPRQHSDKFRAPHPASPVLSRPLPTPPCRGLLF
jgi:hypothetical protein